MRSCGPSPGYITHQLLSFPNATFFTTRPPSNPQMLILKAFPKIVAIHKSPSQTASWANQPWQVVGDSTLEDLPNPLHPANLIFRRLDFVLNWSYSSTVKFFPLSVSSLAS